MLVDDHEFQERLQGMICTLTCDYHLRQDLSQIALSHVSLLESGRRHHTRAWYVKSCEYLLRDHLRKGGSVDALKRRHLGCQLGDAETDDKSVPEDVILEDSILGIVAAADLVRELSRRLAPSEAKVLSGLAEGCAVAEIAEQLKISPRTVFNYRKTIVATALQIGLAE